MVLGRLKILFCCGSNIKINQVCGNSHHNRHGLGYTTTQKVSKNKSSKHYQRYISDHHKTINDTYAFSKAVQLQVQSQWIWWMNCVQQDFCWASLMAIPANPTSFCLASTYGTLPSPTNLKRWRIATEAICTLCRKDIHTYFRSLQGITTSRKIYIQAWHCLASSHWSHQNFHFKYKRGGTYLF